jgi:tetratricopeptide (TPR) repeat protein
MKNFLIILFFVFSYASLQSQSYDQYMTTANESEENGDYNNALYYFKMAEEIDGDDPILRKKIIENSIKIGAYDQASKYIKKSKVKDPELESLKYQLMFLEGKYSELENLIQKNKKIALPEKTIRDLAFYKTLTPKKVNIRNLGTEINTTYSEGSGFKIGETFWFFSNKKSKKFKDGTKSVSGIYFKKGKDKVQEWTFPENINSSYYLSAPSFTPDGNRCYASACSYDAAGDRDCKLVVMVKKGNTWTEPQDISPKINLPGVNNTHPTVDYLDQDKNEIIFYSSNKAGGKGGYDIWWITRNQKNQFSEPQFVEKLNTKGDEVTPFISQGGRLLFFSSDGHQGLGGFDVFSSQKDSVNYWTKPINIGLPINTGYNEIYYKIQNDTLAYFSSNKPGTKFLDPNNKYCCYDIYEASGKLESPKVKIPPIVVPPISPPVVDIPNKEIPIVPPSPPVKVVPPSPPVVVVPPSKNIPPDPSVPPVIRVPPIPGTPESFVPFSVYFDNDEPDKRTMDSVTRKKYDETYLKYISEREKYIQEFAAGAKPEFREEAMVSVMDFFQNDVKRGYDIMQKFSGSLIERLKSGNSVNIKVRGFTSPRAKAEYNARLAKRRISSMENFLISYQNGILLPYIKSGKLKITELALGESTAPTTISDNLLDLRNSVYHPDAARERRVEVVEVD